MDSEIRGTCRITYNDRYYEVEYIYYSIEPDDFFINQIYDDKGSTVDLKTFDEIEKNCQGKILSQIREDLQSGIEFIVKED